MKIAFEGTIDEIVMEITTFLMGLDLMVDAVMDEPRGSSVIVGTADTVVRVSRGTEAPEELEEEEAPVKKKKAPAKKTKEPEPEPEEANSEAEDETESEKEEEAPDRRKEHTVDAAETKKKALSLLITLYNAPGSKSDVKDLLEKYDVKKFSEIPEDRAYELLADAQNIEGTHDV